MWGGGYSLSVMAISGTRGQVGDAVIFLHYTVGLPAVATYSTVRRIYFFFCQAGRFYGLTYGPENFYPCLFLLFPCIILTPFLRPAVLDQNSTYYSEDFTVNEV